VGLGNARATLSLAWKGVPVTSTTHTLRVLEAEGGPPLPVSSRLIRSLPHPDRTASAWRVAWTPRGHLFVSGYPSGVVQLWDTQSGKELRRIESPRGYRGSAEYALTPADFSMLYVPTDKRKVHRDPNDPKKPIRFEYSGQVLVWDLATGKPRPPIKPAAGYGVLSARVSPDGKRLIANERGEHVLGTDPVDQVRMYDTTSTRSWGLGQGYSMVAFSADSRRIYLSQTGRTGGQSATLSVFDTEGKELAVLARVKGLGFSSPILSADGKRLAVSSSKGRINEPGKLLVFDLASGKEIASFSSGGDFPFMVPAFSPDGRLLAAGDYNSQVTVWNIDDKAVIRKQKFEGKGMGLALAFSPDGTRLSVPMRVKTDADNARDPDPLDVPQPRVYLFDLRTDRPAEEVVCPHGWTGGVAFSPDGKVLAVGGAGAVHLFDVSKAIR
jgi:WD40 repeat protein